ncbi:MAG: TrmH family RNA methyltransferase [Nitriliruptoraceae bacterium]
MVLTSTRNPRIAELATLARRRVRRERAQHLVEGPRAVAEALEAGLVEEVFLDPDADLSLSVPAGVVVTEVAAHVLARLAETRTPQGVVAVARTPQPDLEMAVATGRVVVLHELADPGNAGTILRTSDAAGAGGVVLTSGSVDPFGPKAVRAAAGSTYHLAVVSDVGLDEVAEACRSAGLRLVGLDARADLGVDHLASDARPTALVLGNEAHGLDAAAVERLDGTVAVPIHGRAESLNVAAAAAVALYALAGRWHDPRS